MRTLWASWGQLGSPWWCRGSSGRLLLHVLTAPSWGGLITVAFSTLTLLSVRGDDCLRESCCLIKVSNMRLDEKQGVPCREIVGVWTATETNGKKRLDILPFPVSLCPSLSHSLVFHLTPHSHKHTPYSIPFPKIYLSLVWRCQGRAQTLILKIGALLLSAREELVKNLSKNLFSVPSGPLDSVICTSSYPSFAHSIYLIFPILIAE